MKMPNWKSNAVKKGCPSVRLFSTGWKPEPARDALGIFTFMVGHDQPTFDHELVKPASISDIDAKQVQGYLEKIQHVRSNIWSRLRLNGIDLVDQIIALETAQASRNQLLIRLLGEVGLVE